MMKNGVLHYALANKTSGMVGTFLFTLFSFYLRVIVGLRFRSLSCSKPRDKNHRLSNTTTRTCKQPLTNCNPSLFAVVHELRSGSSLQHY